MMSSKQRKTNGFTLIELLVAVGILAVVLSFAGVIFRVSIDSHRTAIANAEIMQKLRAITEQLNADFKGLRKDAPLLIWFQQDPSNPQQRYDQIMFFADGDFQSIQLYNYYDRDYNGSPFVPPVVPPVLAPAATGVPIRDNVARIYYGQASIRDSRANVIRDPFSLLGMDRVLARNRHILTKNPDIIDWSTNFNALEIIYNKYPNNDFYEHDKLSLSEWKDVDQATYNQVVRPTGFVNRPQIDKYDSNTLHNLMSEGLGSFSVQLGYWDPGPDPDNHADDYYGWYPSYDSDGNPYVTPNDSHFSDMGPRSNMFGVSFNTPELPSGWFRIEDGIVERRIGDPFPTDFFPDALKFTFRLYDSKGIIKEVRYFTHIVYLD